MEDLLEYALQQIGEAKKNGERARYRSRASLLTSRGKEAADRIFRQDAGKEQSKYQRLFIGFMWPTVARLTRKGWTTEEEIAEEMIRTSKFSGVKWQVAQFRPLLTNGEHYTLQVVTNDLRIKLMLPDHIPTRKKIIVPVYQVDVEMSLDIESTLDQPLNPLHDNAC